MAWDQALKWWGGGGAKKIGERSERESLGRDKDEGVRPPSPPPQSTTRLAWLADFLLFHPVFAYSLHYGAWSQLS